jgi:hypothetical protein
MNNRKEMTIVLLSAAGAAFWGAAGAGLLALIRSLPLGNCLFFLSASLGFLILFVDGIWAYQFKSWTSRIHKVKISAPHKCPSCGADIKLSETPKTSRLGLPQSDLAMDCPACLLHLDNRSPYTYWLVAVRNPDTNPEFAFLYNDERLTDLEIHAISLGRHTAKAYEKLRARSLSRIAEGQWEELRNMTPPMLRAGPSIQVEIYPEKPDFLPNEHGLVSFNPIQLLEQRTRQNTPVWVSVTRGRLTLTTHRFLFDGDERDVEKRLSDIEDFQLDVGDLLVRRKGKKRPEKFTGLDAPLAASVLKGARR